MMEEQQPYSLNGSYNHKHREGGPLAFADLQPDVLSQILQWLQPRELGACRAVCTELRACASRPLLWYHVYCAKYRNSPPTPPPNFEGLLKGIKSAASSSGLTTGEVVGLSDSFPWKDLVVKREQISARVARPDDELLDAAAGLTVTRRCGMIDLVNATPRTIRRLSQNKLAVLTIPVADLVLPMANARPMAYAEFYVLGERTSIGLVPSVGYKISRRTYVLLGRESTQVGCGIGSIGYRGDNGRIYSGGVWDGHRWGAPTFGYDPDRVQANNATNAPHRPDVVGVGVEPDARTVFFTKNGNLVGSIRVACREGFATDRYCYFAVCIHGPGDVCSMNFGAQPFLFDVEKYSKLPRPDPKLRLSDNGEEDNEDEDYDDNNDDDGSSDSA